MHVCSGIWPMFIHALIQRFSIENWNHEEQNFETRASQRPDRDKLEFENQFSKSTEQCRQIFTAIEKVNYYFCGLKPPICEEMLKEIRRMVPNQRSNHIDIRNIAAGKGLFQHSLMGNAQPLKLMHTKTNKKRAPTYMLVGSPDAPSTGPCQPTE